MFTDGNGVDGLQGRARFESAVNESKVGADGGRDRGRAGRARQAAQQRDPGGGRERLRIARGRLLRLRFAGSRPG